MNKKENKKLLFDHIALNVEDIKKSYEFYHDILGLKEEWTGISHPEGEPIGTQKVKLKSFEEKPQKVLLDGLELYPKAKSPFIGRATQPFHHLSFAVKNIEEASKKLKAKGIDFDSSYTEGINKLKYPEYGLVVKFAFFRDPDGIPVELVEWKKI